MEKPRDSDLAGSYYQVKPGDTLAVISQKFNVSVEEIMYINGITDQRSLQIGQALFLPDPDPIGKKIAKLKEPHIKKPTLAKNAAEKKSRATNARLFDFPVPDGIIIREYSQAKNKPYDGIGIKAPRGTRVNASLDGRVLFVGDDGTKFGLIVIIEHIDSYMTVYTHLDKALVKIGQQVKRGESIGLVGQSGGVAIPHLHFQIRVSERPKNPRLYLNRY